MVFDLGYTGTSFPWFRACSGLFLLYLGLNIRIIRYTKTEDGEDGFQSNR